jgi:hypothetical protein
MILQTAIFATLNSELGTLSPADFKSAALSNKFPAFSVPDSILLEAPSV